MMDYSKMTKRQLIDGVLELKRQNEKLMEGMRFNASAAELARSERDEARGRLLDAGSALEAEKGHVEALRAANRDNITRAETLERALECVARAFAQGAKDVL